MNIVGICSSNGAIFTTPGFLLQVGRIDFVLRVLYEARFL